MPGNKTSGRDVVSEVKTFPSRAEYLAWVGEVQVLGGGIACGRNGGTMQSIERAGERWLVVFHRDRTVSAQRRPDNRCSRHGDSPEPETCVVCAGVRRRMLDAMGGETP